MPESIALITGVGGFGLIIVAVTWLGASHHAHGGLLSVYRADPWPRGLQESDTPHFAVEHADGLRRGSPAMAVTGHDDQHLDPVLVGTEVVELYTRRLGPHD